MPWMALVQMHWWLEAPILGRPAMSVFELRQSRDEAHEESAYLSSSLTHLHQQPVLITPPKVETSRYVSAAMDVGVDAI